MPQELIRGRGPIWCGRLLAMVLCLAPFTARAETPDKLLEQATRLYDEGRFEESIRILEQARTGAQTSDPKVADRKLLARIHLLLGVNHALLAAMAQAKQAMAEALKNDPELTIDPERYKKAVVDLFAEAKNRPRSWITVRSTPPGAEVLVNGKSAGVTPLEHSEVAPGELQLAVSLSGYYEQTRSLRLEDRKEETIEVALAARPPVLRPGTHPFSADIQLGGSLAVRGDQPNMFTLTEELGYHFSGRASGFAIGLALEESWGSDNVHVAGYDDWGRYLEGDLPTSSFVFQVGPKLWWDIQLLSKAALYLTPTLRLAYVYFRNAIDDSDLSQSGSAGAARVGLELKLILFDRLQLIARPLGLNAIIGDEDDMGNDGWVLQYDLSLGLGATF